MLSLDHISKAYGIQQILADVSFVINPGERAGLVGPNGSGKTTLLRIIAGVEPPDSGHVALTRSAALGYLRQGLEPEPGVTLAGGVRAGLGAWEAARAEVDGLAESMAGESGPALEKAMHNYDKALARFEALGGYTLETHIAEMLAHLGLGEIDQDAELAKLSGGEQTRAGLASILLARPDVLLLDEPTNHLDISALEWLEAFVLDYPGAVLIVSHDRVFLDHVATRILELDGKTHTITAYTGNYSDYAEQKAHATARQWDNWRDQQAEIRRMRQDIHQTMEHARWVERTTTPRQPGVRRIAKKVAKKAKSREKKLDRYLESSDRVDKPGQTWGLKFDFAGMPRSGQDVLTLMGIGHSFAARPGSEGPGWPRTQDSMFENGGRGWPRNQDSALENGGRGWLMRDLSAVVRHGDRVALVGPNGAGKSTLLRILAGDLDPAEGSVRLGANVRIGYMPQKQETLDPASTPLAVIMGAALTPQSASAGADGVRPPAVKDETDARNFLHFFLFTGDEVFTPIADLSYGERSRLLLAKLIVAGANCLILDEPVNHLDIPARERFEDALEAFPGTIIAAAHDRAFIARFASTTWRLENGQLKME